MTEEAASGIMEQEREAALALGRLAQELAAQDAGRDEQQAQLQREQASVERLRAALDALAAQQLAVQVWLPACVVGCLVGTAASAAREVACWGLCAVWLQLQLSAGLLHHGTIKVIMGAMIAACATCATCGHFKLAGSAVGQAPRPCPTALHNGVRALTAWSANAGSYCRCSGKGAGAGS